MTYQDLSLRELRQRRERAMDWITYASWMAMASAALSAVILVLWLIGDHPPQSRQDLGLLAGAAADDLLLGLVGWDLGRRRSQWNAWALMTLYVLSIVIDIVVNGHVTSLILRGASAVLYVLGFMGTVEYPELTAAIADRAATEAAMPDTPHAG